MKIKPARLFIFFCLLCPYFGIAQDGVYEVTSGWIRFHSDAPQELIRASSKSLAGVVDINKRTFLFRISLASFDGFNSPRQKEHFNENYMETELFPFATYAGKIIEEVNLAGEGEYNIRAKGKLNIHGVEHQRTIRCVITCKSGVVSVRSDFVVLLADHNIKIPRIVSDKLSPEIKVTLNAILKLKPSL